MKNEDVTLEGSKLNCDKAHAQLQWHSLLSIDEALQMTAQWYKAFYAADGPGTMYDLSARQIAQYSSRASHVQNHSLGGVPD